MFNKGTMRLRCKETGFYIYELRGACHVSWIDPRNKDQAAEFPIISGWFAVMQQSTGRSLEAMHTGIADQPIDVSEVKAHGSA